MFLHPHGKFDNHASKYLHIEALPLAAAMGAEIRGVNIPQITDAQFEEVRHALFRHKMIYFRGQQLGHAEQRGLQPALRTVRRGRLHRGRARAIARSSR